MPAQFSARVLTFLLVLVAGPARSALAQTSGPYQIKFERAQKVGDEYGFQAEAHQTIVEETFYDGVPQPDRSRTKKYWVQLRGQVSVTAVDAKGRPTALTCTVINCRLEVDDLPTRAIRPKDVITVEARDGSTFLTFADREAPAEVRDALLLVFRVSANVDEHTADELLGTPDKKSPGEKWPINAAAAAANFSIRGESVPAENISGESSLLAVRDYAGMPCLQVKSSMRIEDYAPGINQLPPSFKLSKGLTIALVEGFMPTNPAALIPEEKSSLNMDLELRGTTGIKNTSVLVKKSVKRDVTRRSSVSGKGLPAVAPESQPAAEQPQNPA